MKKLGIIGGMGPEATIDMIQKILRLTDASCDQDHIPLLVDFITGTPDRTRAALDGGPSPLTEMIASAKRLEAAGAEALTIACNTAHYWFDEIAASVKIPVWNMIETVAATVERGPVGLLGTKATLRLGLYHKAFEERTINLIEPDDMTTIQDMIYAVKAGKSHPDLESFTSLIKRMQDQGAKVFVLGCTELPIAFDRHHLDVATIDPALLIAKKAILWAGGRIKEEV